MKMRFAAACLAACLVGGCTDTDWDHTLSYVGMSSSKPEAPVPAEAAAAPAPEPAPAAQAAAVDPASEAWCKQAATYERDNAASEGFDAATQQHLYEAHFNQCMKSPGAAPH